MEDWLYKLTRWERRAQSKALASMSGCWAEPAGLLRKVRRGAGGMHMVQEEGMGTSTA